MRHLRLYRAILLVVREGSIRKAAESLTISPSALNRSIQAFEAEIGVKIFERVSNGVRLSSPGELLIRPISEHLAQIDDFLGLVSDMRGGQTGALRLSVSGDLWPGLATKVADRFRGDHPGVGLDICIDNGLDALRARSVDLALVTVPLSDDDVEVVLSGRLPVRGQVPARLPLGDPEFRLSDLMDYRVIVPPIGTGLRLSFDLMVRRTRVVPGSVLSVPGPPNQLMTDPVPDLLLSLSRPESGAPLGLRPVDLSALGLPAVQVTLVSRANGYLPRAAERFSTALGAVLDGLLAPDKVAG